VAVSRLNQEVIKALAAKEVRDGLLAQGFEPSATSPEQFDAFVASETAKWSRAVKLSGAKLD
jgi:tripartite-type tricarboxylate transporter receptor subunit TctC